jgi:hypothetical protein
MFFHFNEYINLRELVVPRKTREPNPKNSRYHDIFLSRPTTGEGFTVIEITAHTRTPQG